MPNSSTPSVNTHNNVSIHPLPPLRMLNPGALYTCIYLPAVFLGVVSQYFKGVPPHTHTQTGCVLCLPLQPELGLDVIEQALADAQQRQAHSKQADLA